VYFSRFMLLFGVFIVLFSWLAFKCPDFFIHGRRSGFWVHLIGEKGAKKLVRWVGVPLAVVIGGFYISMGVIHEKMIWQAEHGKAAAQFDLADHFQRGDFQAEDLDTAIKWYTRAAENGSIAACIRLADIYAADEWEDNDPIQAFKWLLAAARLGDAHAQESVAYRYLEGIGVEKNLRQAANWYMEAAPHASTSACINLGILALKHFREDRILAVKARKMLEKAVTKNDSKGKAARVLAQMTLEGVGGPPDTAKGYAWSCLAAARGSAGARKASATLDRLMTPQEKELAEAQRKLLFDRMGDGY
jgi:TPR repeat protein